MRRHVFRPAQLLAIVGFWASMVWIVWVAFAPAPVAHSGSAVVVPAAVSVARTPVVFATVKRPRANQGGG